MVVEFESDHPDQEEKGSSHASFFFSIQFYYTSFRENRDVCLPNIFPRYFHDGSNFNHQLSTINEQRNCSSRITPTKKNMEAIKPPFSFPSSFITHRLERTVMYACQISSLAIFMTGQISTINYQLSTNNEIV